MARSKRLKQFFLKENFFLHPHSSQAEALRKEVDALRGRYVNMLTKAKANEDEAINKEKEIARLREEVTIDGS